MKNAQSVDCIAAESKKKKVRENKINAKDNNKVLLFEGERESEGKNAIVEWILSGLFSCCCHCCAAGAEIRHRRCVTTAASIIRCIFHIFFFFSPYCLCYSRDSTFWCSHEYWAWQNTLILYFVGGQTCEGLPCNQSISQIAYYIYLSFSMRATPLRVIDFMAANRHQRAHTHRMNWTDCVADWTTWLLAAHLTIHQI